MPNADTASQKTHIIVLGNEKGGSGKTTITIHLLTYLLQEGHSVSSIDIDCRQRSLSQFIKNRKKYILDNKLKLTFPYHFSIEQSNLDSKKANEAVEKNLFLNCLQQAREKAHYVIIDAPGNDTYLSRLAHSYADTILTPLNDSFIDLSVIAKINDSNFQMEAPSHYSEMIWEAKIAKAKRDGGNINWIILRNRLANIAAKNKFNMTQALAAIGPRLGFQTVAGLTERVIYRELFLKGLSLTDLIKKNDHHDMPNIPFTLQLSHIAARQELRNLIQALPIII